MKNLRKSLLLILALIAFGPTAWAQFSGGTGTETDPYQISSEADWNTLADNVNNGTNTYSGQFFKMTTDIGPVTKMVGSSKDNCFQGTFDGDGHTLTVNYNTSVAVTAPFRYVDNATFKRLRVSGVVKSSERYAGGIVSMAYGDINFISCRSSVNLEVKQKDNGNGGYIGGFVAYVVKGHFNFVNCLFDGKIKVKDFQWIGGIVGFIYNPLYNPISGNVVNCFFNPESCDAGGANCASTLVCHLNYDEYDDIYTISNSYYTHKIYRAQGTNASSWTNDQLLAALGSGWHVVDGEVVPDMSITPYIFTGESTQALPYLIASDTDWNGLANNINHFCENYSGKYFQLTDDITLTETVSTGPSATMLGLNDNMCFRGTFDGNGHTITLNYTDNSSERYCAPFRFINGATIKDLHVDGTIVKTDKRNAGGFVGKAYGTNLISNCVSSVDIQSSNNGDGSHGGFMGDLHDGTTTFKNCVFNGKLQGTNTKRWGGFVGWVDDGKKAYFNNCLFAPTLVNVKNDGNRTFARRDDGDDVVFNNSYYTQTLGSAQGKEACTISGTEYDNGTTVTATPYGTEEPGISGGITAYSLGNDTYNPCLKYDDVVYSGSGNNVQLNLSQNGGTPSGAQANSFIATPGSLSGTASPYTLNMANTNTLITLAPTDFEVGHIGSIYSDPYPIYTTEQWDILAQRVNSGEHNGYNNMYFKLMADITVSQMVGNEGNPFKATFDGNGHTLNLALSGSGDCTAPFASISGATIKNLHITGTISTTGMRPASIASFVVDNSTIASCWSEVAISSSRSSDIDAGGLVARVNNGKSVTITDCLFSGSITYSNTNGYEGGGMVGYTQDNATATLTNCLFAPTAITVKQDSKSYIFVSGKERGTLNNCYYNEVASASNLQNEGLSAIGMDNETLRFALGEAWENKNNQVTPIMSLYLFSGTGYSDSSPYLITSTEDWNGLVSNVYLGQNYSNAKFQLTDDISITRMVGSNETNSFRGTFDGDGYTLTFTANTTADYTAPFRYVNGADIQNLVVGGTITTSAQFAAGFIGYAIGDNSITNCRSSITISSSVTGDGTHGGFIANIHNGATDITGCVFNGRLLGSNTTNCGGFVGWTRTDFHYASININKCLYAPASGENAVSSDGSYTFTRYQTGNNGYPPSILNSFYTQALGTTQGKHAYSITAGEYVNMEMVANDSTEYDVSGITLYPVGIQFNNVLYACNEDEVSLNLSNEIPEGFTFNGYNVSNDGTLNGEDPYTLTMPDADVTITANYSIEWQGAGTEEDPYLIYQPVQLDLLATRVNSDNSAYNDKYYKLMADIEYDANVADNFTPIGATLYNQGEYVFNGHFDGNGYTISGINTIDLLNFSNGLFGDLGSSAEVKNIVLANSTIGAGQRCGGIVGLNEGGSVTNCHVTSTVTIKGDNPASIILGGVVGYNMGGGLVSQCTFAGTITKPTSEPPQETYYFYGGIAGYNINATLSDNAVVGATIPTRTNAINGAIVGAQNGTLARNYYVNCTVGDVANATGVGCYNLDAPRPYPQCDITANDGAVPGNKIILAERITSDATVFTIPTVGELEEQTFSVAAFGATVTLGYELSGYEVTYYVDEEPIEGNTFTMPDEYVEAVVVDATVIPVVTLDIAGYGNSDGGYYLIAIPFVTVNPANVAGMTDGNFDLYAFDQAEDKEWRNYKAGEGFNLEAGRGYLYAHDTDITLIFTGELYSGNGEVTLNKTDDANADFQGWNLVGNPFNDTAYIADGRSFYTMNAEGSEIIAATSNSIAPMEGIFVIANQDEETMTFTTEAPSNSGKSLALNISQGRGVIDRAIVRFDEGNQQRNLPKFQMRSNSTKVYIPQDGKDYAMVNVCRDGACTVSTEIPVNFKAQENGVYTLTVSGVFRFTSHSVGEPFGVPFSVLRLIDNLTGTDIDLLATPSYTFEAKTTDNASRFKLVVR